MKALENFKVHWDKSVRNSGNMIVQFAYGDDGFDPMRVEKQPGQADLADPSRVLSATVRQPPPNPCVGS